MTSFGTHFGMFSVLSAIVRWVESPFWEEVGQMPRVLPCDSIYFLSHAALLTFLSPFPSTCFVIPQSEKFCFANYCQHHYSDLLWFALGYFIHNAAQASSSLLECRDSWRCSDRSLGHYETCQGRLGQSHGEPAWEGVHLLWGCFGVCGSPAKSALLLCCVSAFLPFLIFLCSLCTYSYIFSLQLFPNNFLCSLFKNTPTNHLVPYFAAHIYDTIWPSPCLLETPLFGITMPISLFFKPSCLRTLPLLMSGRESWKGLKPRATDTLPVLLCNSPHWNFFNPSIISILSFLQLSLPFLNHFSSLLCFSSATPTKFLLSFHFNHATTPLSLISSFVAADF